MQWTDESKRERDQRSAPMGVQIHRGSSVNREPGIDRFKSPPLTGSFKSLLDGGVKSVHSKSNGNGQPDQHATLEFLVSEHIQGTDVPERGLALSKGSEACEAFTLTVRLALMPRLCHIKRRLLIPLLSTTYLALTPFVGASPSTFTSGGISTGPPGESASLAVRTSTPSSVTSRVCSN